MVGQNIGKYRVLDRIGRGGMGTVYRAVDETLHRDVAIKVLNAELNDPEVAKRFRAEAITVARLSHPGIATIYELFQHEGQWLMVMEFVRGETLERLAERSGPLPPERTAELCMQTLAALAHAHSMGVVHRDLKPANIMVTETGGIKVMDFGIARVAGTEHLTSAGFMMGTPAYMAPEQVMGKEIDARADLYAMGVVFYRLTAGRLPFKADTPFAMAQSQVNDPPAPIGQVRSDLPAWVNEVLTRALAKNPGERFQSAIEFHEAFARCLEGQPMPPPYSSSAPTEMLRTPSRLPTGSLGRIPTPPSMPPLTGQAASSSGAVPLEVAPTVLSPTPGTEPTVMAATPASPIASPSVSSVPDATMASPATTSAGSGAAAPPTPATSEIAGRALAGDLSPAPASAPAAPVRSQPAKSASPAKGGSARLVLAAVAVVLVGGVAAWLAMRSAAPAPEPSAAAPVTAPEIPPPAPAPAAEAAPMPPPEAPPPAAAPAAAGDTPAGAPAPPRSTGRGARGGVAGGRAADAPASPAVEEAPISIDDVKLFVVRDRNKTDDQDITLSLAGGNIMAVAKRGGAVLASIPYEAAAHATYIKARDPKWDVTMTGPPLNVDVGGMLRTSKHWIVIQAADRYMILRLEDSNWRRALDAIRTRTGLTIDLPTSTDRD